MDTPDNNLPKKYIRTFEADMKTLQEGGIPDLTPLEKSESKPKERVIEKPTPPAPPKAAPVPPPPALTPPPEVPKAIPPPPQPPATPIETYAGDFTNRVKETHASTATVLAAEQDSATGAPKATPQKATGHTLAYVIAGVVLLLAGAAGAYFAYTHYMTVSAPVVVAPTVSTPIVVDDREEVSGTGVQLLAAMAASVSRPLTPGTVRLLYEASTTDSIFAALHTTAPDILVRNVNAQGSMAGVVNVNGNQSAFLILSVSSYSNTFSGMLSWEPLMRRDLAALFPPYPELASTSPVVATSTATTTPAKGVVKKVATSTPTVSAPAAPTTFVDDTIANHDVRIYRDATGKSIILYGYWNQSTLVIARDSEAFTAILERLATTRAP